jgi:hypothetical protein
VCARAREAAAAAVRRGEEDDRAVARVSVRRGGACWLGRPKAEAQWWLVAVAQWEGKGEWADRGGRRGGLRLGRMRSRIQK